MSNITTEQIKDLRDRTGISVMQCRKALEESKGNLEKALIILRKQGAQSAAKKSERSLGSGVISAYVHSNSNIGALVELSCETDFVARNDEFKKLAYDIAMQAAATKPEFLSLEDVDETSKAKAKELFEGEVADKGADLKEKILEGKLKSYFSEKTLLDQPFIKNPEITIRGLIEGAIHKFGEKAAIRRFCVYRVLDK